MLMPYAANDPQVQTRRAAFLQALQELGWSASVGHPYRPQTSGRRSACCAQLVAELVASGSDVIFTVGSPAMAPLRQATRTIPIVFAIVPDPVGAGFVDNLARPGG